MTRVVRSSQGIPNSEARGPSEQHPQSKRLLQGVSWHPSSSELRGNHPIRQATNRLHLPLPALRFPPEQPSLQAVAPPLVPMEYPVVCDLGKRDVF